MKVGHRMPTAEFDVNAILQCLFCLHYSPQNFKTHKKNFSIFFLSLFSLPLSLSSASLEWSAREGRFTSLKTVRRRRNSMYRGRYWRHRIEIKTENLLSQNTQKSLCFRLPQGQVLSRSEGTGEPPCISGLDLEHINKQA